MIGNLRAVGVGRTIVEVIALSCDTRKNNEKIGTHFRKIGIVINSISIILFQKPDKFTAQRSEQCSRIHIHYRNWNNFTNTASIQFFFTSALDNLDISETECAQRW